MARYYFYTADMFYEDKETPGAEVRRVGDYQGVYTVDDGTLTPDAIFANLMRSLKTSSRPKRRTTPTTTSRSSTTSHSPVIGKLV